MLNLHLKLKAQDSASICQLSEVAQLNLNNTVAAKCHLSPQVHVENWQDKDFVEIFEKYSNHFDVLLCPSLGTPDTIRVLLSNETKKPSGFLLAQSKNYKVSLNPTTLQEALSSLDPTKMYQGESMSPLHARLKTAIAALPANFAWIRVSEKLSSSRSF